MQKSQMIENLISNLNESTGVILTNYQGLKVDELTQLRRTLQQASAKYQVIKNSCLLIALKNCSMESLSNLLSGPTGIVFIKNQDPVLPLKKLIEFSKQHEKLRINSGYVFNRTFSAEEITKIAELPSKEILIAQLINLLKLPLMKLLNILQLPQRSLVSILKILLDRAKTKE